MSTLTKLSRNPLYEGIQESVIYMYVCLGLHSEILVVESLQVPKTMFSVFGIVQIVDILIY